MSEGRYGTGGRIPLSGRLHGAIRLGPVHYNVVDVEMMAAFYRDIIGMRVLEQTDEGAVLGTAGGELLRFTRVVGSGVRGDHRTRPRHGTQGGGRRGPTTGLYHTAFLVPAQRDLAHLTRILIETRTPVQGTSDHGTHLAIYLPDPEGNGIELAWDWPRARWPMVDGRLDYAAAPRRGVDVEALLRSIAEDSTPWHGLDPGTRVGHIHLHVADLDEGTRFYNEVLGFDLMLHSAAMGASFLSAGGYHHHVGMNIWKGQGLPPPGPDAPGLRYFTVVVPDRAEWERVAARVQSAHDGWRVLTAEERRALGCTGAPALHVVDPSGLSLVVTVGR